MILPIVKYGDPVLRKMCEPVTKFDQDLEILVKDVVQTMYAAPGYGLAAPQVGVPIRLIVMDDLGHPTCDKTLGTLTAIVNPKIVRMAGEQFEEESCLSIPGIHAKVYRPLQVLVTGQDIHGNEKLYEGSGLLARILCHEIDHLNGVLFIDHLGPVRRDLIKAKIRKKIRAGEWR